MKTEDLKEWGLTEEQSAKVMEQFGKDITKLQKENEKLTADRDSLKASLEDVQGKLDGFKDVDVADLKGQIATLTKDLADEKAARAQDAQRVETEKNVNAFLSAVGEDGNKKYEFINGITEDFFRGKLLEELSKDSAKGKSIGDIFTALITGEDGKQKTDIFVDRKQEQLESGRAKPFTGPLNPNGGGTKRMTREEIFGIKDRSERQKAIAENLSEFQ